MKFLATCFCTCFALLWFSPLASAPPLPGYAWLLAESRTAVWTRALRGVEVRYGLPAGLLAALHSKECSGRIRCPDGRAGERGPFQILPGTAALREVACPSGWESGYANADCAGRFLQTRIDQCGPGLRAIGAYNAGSCDDGAYARDVYSRWLPWSPKPKRMI